MNELNDKKKHSIIIPAYNEECSIVDTITEIRQLRGDFEIIVVDDGSTDETFKLADHAGVKVLKHQENKGYGASLKTGIKNSSYDIIVITDADSTYPNGKIPELVEMFVKDKEDMVVGARIGKNVKIPFLRKPAKWFITKLASFLVGSKIPDLNSGLRVMRKDVLLKYLKIMPNGFSFTSTITMVMLTNDFRVKYTPIDYFKRNGTSKIRPIYDTLNFIQLIIRMVLYFEPLKVFLPLSLPLIIGGVIYAIYQSICFHNIGTITVIIVLSGIQILAIGMVADLIDKRSS